MYSPFKQSPTILALERANDLIELGKASGDIETSSRKRSRHSVVQADNDIVFKEIVKELNYVDLYPTFRTLVLERFYVILACNPQHDYYEDICKIVAAFKHIIHSADKLYYNMNSDDTKEIYYYLTDELKHLLYNSQQIILLFHLSAQSP